MCLDKLSTLYHNFKLRLYKLFKRKKNNYQPEYQIEYEYC